MSPVGAKSSGFWRLILSLILLITISYCLLSAYKLFKPPIYLPIPTSFFPAPSPPLPIPTSSDPSQVTSVIVTTANDNKFDSLNRKQMIVRVSDSSEVVTGADAPLTVHCTSTQSILVWAPGYEIGSRPCNDQRAITLRHLDALDNVNYAWSVAASQCNPCHGNQLLSNPQTGASYDEMNEWFQSGHAKVFAGAYFESMYRGTSANGQPSIPAQPVIIGNEWVPVPPEKSLDYHGPGFQLDYPGQPGNCAYCHVPAAIPGSQQSMELMSLFPQPAGALGEGVTCDICHKVFDVILADNQFPFIDRPGILSFRFLRPNNGIFMTGPFSNVLTARRDGTNVTIEHGSTCAPVFSRSEFCAPCHFGKFADMVIYNSYGEWKASPYAVNPSDASYRTCQDCHMSHMDVGDRSSLSSERQACSASNTRFQNFDHNMMDLGPSGVSSNDIPRMVKNAAQIDLAFDTQPSGNNTLDVRVSVTNIRAGHNFPTDSPLRHLILVVQAVDRVNTPLIQVGGDRIPNWAGPGPISKIAMARNLIDPGIPDYGGLPGKIFANLLVEEETNLSPAMAYWNETKYAAVNSASKLTSDTRLRPFTPDTSTYSFELPDAGEVKITVQLLYRYAFYDLMVWKEWHDRPDIIVTQMECKGPPSDSSKITCQNTTP